MNDEIPRNPPGAPDEDVEAGEPIGTLWQLEQDTSSSFLARIRRRIYRRTTTSQLISVSWHLPGIVFTELLGILVHLVTGPGMRKRN